MHFTLNFSLSKNVGNKSKSDEISPKTNCALLSGCKIPPGSNSSCNRVTSKVLNSVQTILVATNQIVEIN
jgi:hypothetical protein